MEPERQHKRDLENITKPDGADDGDDTTQS